MVIPPGSEHLGGYILGGDEATYYPDLWDWLVRGPIAVKSMIDVGCGDGVAVRHFQELGVAALGIDGVDQEHRCIIQHDYTIAPFYPNECDLIWCCEFVEHVEQAYMHNFLETFKSGRIVLMTHAFPNQSGHHHVNCQNPSFWIEMLRSSGFAYDPYLTDITRQLAAKNKNPWNHYVRSGLAFVKTGP